jgi:cyclopropane fatty-acyl-phospholipid synthase-like methyltransferase
MGNRHELVGSWKSWKATKEFQLQFLKESGLVPEHFILDIGCGTLLGGVSVIDYLHEGHYFGIEAREHVLAEGRKELQENGLSNKNPVLIHEDIQHTSLDRKFDFIWAYSVVIHMTDDIVDSTFELVSKHLQDEGSFYFNVSTVPREQGLWQGFPVVWRLFSFYEEIANKYGLMLSDVGSMKEVGRESRRGRENIQRMLRISK